MPLSKHGGIAGTHAVSLGIIIAGACVNPDKSQGPLAQAPLLTETASTPDAPPSAGGINTVEPESAESCSDVAAQNTGVDCRTRQTASVDLDHDGKADCVRWVRCGPEVPRAVSDGGFEYPEDAVTVTISANARRFELYTNRRVAEAECFQELEVLRIGAERHLLTRAAGYGTGNFQLWAIQDIVANRVRRWIEPKLDAAVAPILRPGERLGEQFEYGIDVRDGALEVARLVYRATDDSCCSTGGLAKVLLVPGPDGLRTGRAWREPNHW